MTWRANRLRIFGSLALGALALAGCLRPDRDREEAAKKTAPSAEVPASDVRGSAPATPTPTPAADAPVADPPVTPPPPPGKIDSIVEVTGEQLLERIRASKARGTVVNAWASWCGPCKEEFPMLVTAKAKLGPRGVEVVFVSVDEEETQAAARAFAQENGLSGELLVATRPLGPFKKALNPEWPGMLPATFLFDSVGKLRHFWGGPVYEDELMPVVDGFLSGRAVDGKSMPGLSPGLDLRD